MAAAMLVMALVSGASFWSYGLYLSPLEEEFGWSRAEASLGSSFALLFSGICSPTVGRIIDRRGPRFSIVVGTILTCLGYLLLATTAALWQWYLYNGILAIFRQMMFFIPFQAVVSRWFDARRGRALSLVNIGFSLGGLLVLPLLGFVIDERGWQVGLVSSGLAIALVVLPLGLFVVRDSPRRAGEHIDGKLPTTSGRIAQHPAGVPLSAALWLPFFWLTAFGFGFFLYGLFGWAVHQVPFWESEGYSRSTATAIVSLSSGLGIGFRLTFVLIADRIRRYETAAAVFGVILTSSMLLILFDTGTAAIGLFIFLWILGSGGPFVESLLVARSFGVTYFATILGTVMVVETLTQIVSPTLAGFIFDSTGSYDLALAMFAAAFIMASFLFTIATRFPPPLEQYARERAAGASPAR